MLTPLNFIRVENGKMVYIEHWFDRCIDRNEEYIPSYPFWKTDYTPQKWIEEGLYEVKRSHYSLVEKLKEKAAIWELKVVNEEFVEKSEGVPKEEAGWEVYSIPSFLSLNHKEVEYEGYVFYGVSKIYFDEENLTKFQSFVNEYINQKQ